MSHYPLLGTEVLSIFEYIKHEEEQIHLGVFTFDYVEFFGLVPTFNYNIDFVGIPGVDEGGTPVYNPDNYGVIYTCDEECDVQDFVTTYNVGDILAGPAFKIVNGSTKDNATLYAVIYDPFNELIIIGAWVNSPLITFDRILYVFSLALALNDVIHVLESQATPGTFEIYVNDILLFTFRDTTIQGTCFGMVELQTITQNPGPVNENIAGTTSVTARFWYCNDGISVINNLLPVPIIPSQYGLNDFDSQFDATVKCGLDGDKCFGFLRAQLFNHGENPPSVGDNPGDYFFLEMQYKGGSGNARSGICLRVDETKADPNDFTGFGVIIDKDKMFICSWVNKSLAFYHRIHVVINYQLSVDELISVEYNGWSGFTQENRNIRVWTKKAGEGYVQRGIFFNPEAIIPLAALLPNRRADTNVGIVWVGNDAFGIHTARWVRPEPAVSTNNIMSVI